MPRAIILVLDSFGVGQAPDADKYGDIGANTFINLARHYFDKENTIIHLPNLGSLGLHQLSKEACSPKVWHDFTTSLKSQHGAMEQFFILPSKGAYGYMAELSTGKDTPSGHWEMAGVPVLFDWDYFENKTNAFSNELIEEINNKTGFGDILGNCHASGTDIINQLGEQHIRSGLPICYTSADSVFQVAAHEEHFGLDNLYKYCENIRELLDESDLNIGRVIARPFIGNSPNDFTRTGNRRDYSVSPPSATVLEKITNANGEVISVGKIADIYAHQGISIKTKATGIDALVDATMSHIESAPNNSLIFTNLVNFDQDFGHRRDPIGYAKALESFDKRLPEIIARLKKDDVLFLTADHGCDPTWPGNDHTREFVPILAYHHNINSVSLGHRSTFADLGQTIAALFSLDDMEYGSSFLSELHNK